MPACACCTAFQEELKGPIFDLCEQSPSNDDTPQDKTSTRHLDIERTFSPSPRLPCIGAKIFLMAWTIALLIQSIRKSTHKSFWLAYLTHWSFVFASAYFIASVSSAIYLARRPPSNPGVLEGGVGVLVKSTWILFAISLPTEILVAILFWTLQFDGNADYVSIMLHAGIVGLLFIDGIILSRIPLRMKQLLPNLLFCFFYLLWTVIHAFSGLGNPYKDDGSRDDDAIYNTIAWKNDPATAGLVCAGVFFVGYPVVFSFCRMVSRLPPRRLCDEEDRKFEAGGTAEKEGTLVNDEEAPAQAPQAVAY